MIVQVFVSLILGLTPGNGHSQIVTNETLFSTAYPTVHSTADGTVHSNDPLSNDTPLERSLGNEMVMAMLSGFLTFASITQLVMYFLVIRNSNVGEGRKNQNGDASYDNKIFK